ncbi:hypothetical protein [Ralstonia sp. 1138]
MAGGIAILICMRGQARSGYRRSIELAQGLLIRQPALHEVLRRLIQGLE